MGLSTQRTILKGVEVKYGRGAWVTFFMTNPHVVGFFLV